ncbi:MAG TPA: hypothetical protein VIV11_28470, partial [Kofleriaceae bacterium]
MCGEHLTLQRPRALAMVSSGRFVAVRRSFGIEVIDALGASPRCTLERAADDFAIVGHELWVLAGAAIERFGIEGLRPIEPAVDVGAGAQRVHACADGNAASALVTGARTLVVETARGRAQTFEIPPLDMPVFPLGGRRLLAAGTPLRIIEAGRGEIARLACADRGALAASYLFGGRALVVLFDSAFVVLAPQGGLIHRIEVPSPRAWAIAESRGTALLALADGRLITVDLRYGRVLAELEAPLAIEDIAIDTAGQFAAF